MVPNNVTNTYLNVARARHEWKPANFQGQAVIARQEFVAGSNIPAQAWYYTADANSVTTVGTESFDVTGGVTRRVVFLGRAHPSTLAAGQSNSATYTVRVLTPAGTADETQREVLSYVGSDEITLPGGRLSTCKLTSVISSVVAGTTTELSQEQLHVVNNLGLVKSYYKPTAQIFLFDRGQTYLTEMSATTAAVTYTPATAATTPTLASCAAMAAGQELVVTASTFAEGTSARRSTAMGSFNAVSTLQVTRRSFVSDAVQSVFHFEPTLATLQLLAEQTYSNGAVIGTITYGGHPNLAGLVVGDSLSYTETITTTPPGTTDSSGDSFTFVGHEKVTTQAGTFDTCKVRFDYGANNGGGSETYYLLPNVHWARLDRVAPTGVRTTRELVSR
jgi:hypothetical protein